MKEVDHWHEEQKRLALENVWFYARRARNLGATDEDVRAALERAMVQERVAPA